MAQLIFFLVSTTYNNDGTTQTTNSTIEAPDSGNLELVQVQMFPRNCEYILTSIPSTSEQYYCLAFYSDDTVEDVTSSATWTLVDDETGQPVSVDPNTGQAPARFSTQTNGLLILDDTSPEFLRIEVSIGGSDNQKDQTVVKVVTQ